MMVLSKRSLLATVAALGLSLGAGAMNQQDSWQGAAQGGKIYKQAKECDSDSSDSDSSSESSDEVPAQMGKGALDKGCCSQDNSSQCGNDAGQDACSYQQKSFINDDACWQQCGSQFAQQVGDHHITDNKWIKKNFSKVECKSFASIKSHGKRLHRKNWRHAQWSGIQSDNVNLSRVALNGSQISNANLKGKWKHVHFDGATITNSTLSGNFEAATFTGATLQNLNFVDANFGNHHLRGGDFINTTFINVNFINSNIQNMNFAGAILDNVRFPCTQIGITNVFIGAKVRVANGGFVTLTGNHLEQLGADMKQCTQGLFNISAWATNPLHVW